MVGRGGSRHRSAHSTCTGWLRWSALLGCPVQRRLLLLHLHLGLTLWRRLLHLHLHLGISTTGHFRPSVRGDPTRPCSGQHLPSHGGCGSAPSPVAPLSVRPTLFLPYLVSLRLRASRLANGLVRRCFRVVVYWCRFLPLVLESFLLPLLYLLLPFRLGPCHVLLVPFLLCATAFVSIRGRGNVPRRGPAPLLLSLG